MKKLLLALLMLFTSVYAVEAVNSSTTWTTGAYENNAHLSKRLFINDANKLVVKIKGSTEFDYDFVYVYNQNGKLIKKISGAIDTEFLVDGSSIKVELISDDEVTDSGITVNISKSKTDSVTSWKTGEYSNNSNLQKELYINGAKKLNVKIKGSTELDCDFVLIYDQNGNLIQKLSGVIDADFTVNGSAITAQLISDETQTDSGIDVTISKPKDTVSYWNTGKYSNNSNLLKELYINSAKSINVKIQGEVEEDYDFLYIYNKQGDLIKKLSGNINSEFNVDSSSILVKLTSDDSTIGKGVVVTISDLNSSNNQSISLLGSIDSLPNGKMRHFSINKSESKVYFANGYGLYVYNIEDPQEPLFSGNSLDGYNIVVKNNKIAYSVSHPPVISHHTHSDIKELSIVDDSNISKVRQIGRVGGFITEMKLSYNKRYLYVINLAGGIAGPSHYNLYKYNLKKAKYVFKVRYGSYHYMKEIGLTHTDKYLFLYSKNNNKTEVAIYNTKNKNAKKLPTITNIDSNIHKMLTSSDDKKLFIATDKGLKIYDISNISKPKEIVTYPTNDVVYDIALSKDNKKIYMANAANGLEVLDISNLYSITKVANYETPKATKISLSKNESKIYLVDEQNGFLILSNQ